jgi:transcriptional regulator with XRE-family HTH domain
MTARLYWPNPARAAAIRRAREHASMSRYDLARAIGAGETTVRAWEAGKNDPGPANVIRIAEATRVPVSSLLMPQDARAGWPARRETAA